MGRGRGGGACERRQRFELERALFDGELDVDDLPRAWNEKMTELLGVTPETDAKGVLQDVHWSDGSFGYFPSYTLGAMYAAQFHQTAREELGEGGVRLAAVDEPGGRHLHVLALDGGVGDVREAEVLGRRVVRGERRH